MTPFLSEKPMIAEALASYAHATARVFDDRTQTVGASECGQCARKVYWLKNEGDPVLGAPRDPDYVDSWGARARGSVYETHFWEPALRAQFGDNLLFAGATQRTFKSEFLSATPDGLLINQPRSALAALGVPDIGDTGSFIVECKTADPRSSLEKAKSENVFQAICQLGLIRELTEYRPDYALISYTDASFWNEIREFPIKFDETIFTNAKARARRIMTATTATDLPPEGWIAGGRECAFCPFTQSCGRKRTDVPTRAAVEPDPQFVAEIVDMARDVKVCEAEAEAADARLREAQHELRERMRTKGVNRVKADDVSVTWSAVKGRQSFDNKAIRDAAAAAGVDVAQFETVGEPTDRLVIRIM
jgi:hypothetical protein